MSFLIIIQIKKNIGFIICHSYLYLVDLLTIETKIRKQAKENFQNIKNNCTFKLVKNN